MFVFRGFAAMPFDLKGPTPPKPVPPDWMKGAAAVAVGLTGIKGVIPFGPPSPDPLRAYLQELAAQGIRSPQQLGVMLWGSAAGGSLKLEVLLNGKVMYGSAPVFFSKLEPARAQVFGVDARAVEKYFAQGYQFQVTVQGQGGVALVGWKAL